jgi:hypothetical protein
MTNAEAPMIEQALYRHPAIAEAAASARRG